jgi:hypothetical protein
MKIYCASGANDESFEKKCIFGTLEWIGELK